MAVPSRPGSSRCLSPASSPCPTRLGARNVPEVACADFHTGSSQVGNIDPSCFFLSFPSRTVARGLSGGLRILS